MDVADFRQEVLSRRLVAYVAGVKDAKTVSRWAKGEVGSRAGRARGVFGRRTKSRSFGAVRFAPGWKAWFIGLNPQLDDESPAEAIREERLKEAMNAGLAFVAGS